jgi:hypothetical protein
LGCIQPPASILERLSSFIPFPALFYRLKAMLIHILCDGKASFRRASQSFASHCASSSPPVPGESLTFQPDPALGFETGRGEPSVDVSLLTRGCSPMLAHFTFRKIPPLG